MVSHTILNKYILYMNIYYFYRQNIFFKSGYLIPDTPIVDNPNVSASEVVWWRKNDSCKNISTTYKKYKNATILALKKTPERKDHCFWPALLQTLIFEIRSCIIRAQFRCDMTTGLEIPKDKELLLGNLHGWNYRIGR